MTPRDVLPMNAGVCIVFLPTSEMRPRRGASAPVVFRSVNSIISGGNCSKFLIAACSAIWRVQCCFFDVSIDCDCETWVIMDPELFLAWWGEGLPAHT